MKTIVLCKFVLGFFFLVSFSSGIVNLAQAIQFWLEAEAQIMFNGFIHYIIPPNFKSIPLTDFEVYPSLCS
jgi:hypothetical protein